MNVFWYVLSVGGQSVDENGYTIDLTGNWFLSHLATNYFTNTTWLDHLTVGAVFEFALYNVNVNLACMVRVFWEFPASGGARSSVQVYSMRFFRAATHALHYFILFWELVFVLHMLYMIVLQVLRVREQGLDYFKKISTYLDICACLLCITVVVLYIIFNKEIFTLVRMFNQRRELLAHFRYVASIDNALTIVYGFLLAVVTLKLLHLLRFNPIIFRFTRVLSISAPKLVYVIGIITFTMFGFGWVMALFCGGQQVIFRDVGSGMEAMFESVLGAVYIDETKVIDEFWGPFLYLFFVVFILFIGVNLLISVIIEALVYANHEDVLNSDAEVLTMLIFRTVQYFGLKKRTDRI